MTREQFIEISEWQKKTFGSATPISKIYHLNEEVNELLKELKSYYFSELTENKNQFLNVLIKEEFADCFLLLFGAASAHGMDYDDICKSIDLKMEINRKRKWGKPNENGVVNHIK